MKKVSILLIIAASFLFAGCQSCPPCPRENINVPVIMHPQLPPMLIPFSKGELDKTQEERGYKIYTDEEVKELQEKFNQPQDSDDHGDNKNSCAIGNRK